MTKLSKKIYRFETPLNTQFLHHILKFYQEVSSKLLRDTSNDCFFEDDNDTNLILDG